MPFFAEYIFKVSVSLAVVYIFYHIALRRLTFYNWNRWYLLAYTFISFLVPFIDVSLLLDQKGIEKDNIVYLIPSFKNIRTALPENGLSVIDTGWGIITLIILIGIACMIFRLIVQLIAYKKITSKGRLITDNGIRIYEVDRIIIPFSFGRSVFINPQLHSENELAEIVRHEFVHVRQMHTIDILWGEFLCIVNWFNPFVWLIRKAIRQNLEFIADNKVLQEGIDKKEYQYLLLKVTGNNHYSIANQFNFSSLKKRIAMMNKMRSAKMHLLKFLFILPLIAVMLLVFRTEGKSQTTPKQPTKVGETAIADTINTGLIRVNNKGYFLGIIGQKENCIVVVSDKNSKTVENVLLTEWNAKKEHYENLYGELPVLVKKATLGAMNSKGYSLDLVNDNKNMFVYVRDRNNKIVERILMDKWNANSKYYENLYGELPPPPPPPTPPLPVSQLNSKGHIIEVVGQGRNLEVVIKDKSNKEVNWILLETWNANKKYYENLYGELPKPPPPPPPPLPAPTQKQDINNETGSIKNPAFEFHTATFVADMIRFNSKDKSFNLKGKATLNDEINDVNLSAELINFKDMASSLVIINGKEVEWDKDYINGKREKFMINMLQKDEAVKKYGDKGKSGVLEINSIAL